ncbi:glycoside hydrolase family 9 protein [Chitinophaga sp. MM2321]|uniref:glycoside hydrolase family 9 protein n=1 Tax=Chitinophaga sp. MM2321 TaxID=3137178 RepID=UPI0032D59CDA
MQLFRISIAIPLSLLMMTTALFAQQSSQAIRLNQAGFYTKGPKQAVIMGSARAKFYIISTTLQDTVFAGVSGEELSSAISDVHTSIADFSRLTVEGRFVLAVPGVGVSYPFDIKGNVHAAAFTAAMKSYYFMRASTPVTDGYAGKWSRAGGHPDTLVQVHPSAASVLRPAGSIISSPGGWYDAGDYNKYIVNSGITMATLFSLYEDFPVFIKAQALNIPADEAAVPAYLRELLWNLRWMLSMQDPADGGVYHKLTNAQFDGVVMPAAAIKPRYVVAKSTAATLDFAAVTAQAARILKAYEAALPGLSDSCRAAAIAAWQWARQHPAVLYEQEKMNLSFAQAIKTGAYGDGNVSDEFSWAATELSVTTGLDSFYAAVPHNDKLAIPNWSHVSSLGYYTMIRHARHLPKSMKREARILKRQLLAAARDLMMDAAKQGYGTVMGKNARDFVWGSNSVAANQGVLLIQAFRLKKRSSYMAAAVANMDYLLGRNGTGYCFLTGFGTRSPMHPHHRLSEADNVIAPIPGLLVGGPNPGMQDKCQYPSTIPDQCYIDAFCSYASNEVAINWNAPFVYLAGALEALWEDR